MSEVWYWKLGFSSNPFTIKPGALTAEVVGQQLEPVLERIDAGEFQYVEAPLGSGKTTILKNIISRFGGRRKLVYVSCLPGEGLDITELIRNSSWKTRMLRKLPQGMIMLIDEAQELLPQDAQVLADLKQKGNIKAAVLFGTRYNSKSFPEQISRSIVLTRLSYITPENAVQIVRERTGRLRLMPDYVLREIYSRANTNPRKFLQLCEDVCRKAVDLSIKELTVGDVQNFIQNPYAARQKKQKGRQSKRREKPATQKPVYDVKNIRTFEEEMLVKRDEIT